MIYSFILGSCWGSFLAHLAYCLSHDEKVKFRRSHCDFCLHKLGFTDLIPLIGYLFLGGRCRYCRKKIKAAYFVMEILTGIVFTQLGYETLNDGLLFILISVLAVIAYVDYETMLIGDGSLIIVMALCALLAFNKHESWLSISLGMLVVSGTMVVLNIFKQDCFGWGDVKLMAIIGILLGFEKTLNAALIATLSAGLTAGVLKYLLKSQRKYLPFAPFLVMGIILNLLG